MCVTIWICERTVWKWVFTRCMVLTFRIHIEKREHGSFVREDHEHSLLYVCFSFSCSGTGVLSSHACLSTCPAHISRRHGRYTVPSIGTAHRTIPVENQAKLKDSGRVYVSIPWVEMEACSGQPARSCEATAPRICVAGSSRQWYTEQGVIKSFLPHGGICHLC